MRAITGGIFASHLKSNLRGLRPEVPSADRRRPDLTHCRKDIVTSLYAAPAGRSKHLDCYLSSDARTVVVKAMRNRLTNVRFDT